MDAMNINPYGLVAIFSTISAISAFILTYLYCARKTTAVMQALAALNETQHKKDIEHQVINTQLLSQTTLTQQLEKNLTEAKHTHIDLTQGKHQAESDLKAAQTSIMQLREQLQSLNNQCQEQQQKQDAIQTDYRLLTAKHTQLETTLVERNKNHAEQLAQSEQQKQTLSEQFKLLANDILDAKAKALQENSKISLSQVMTPFQQSVDSFKKEVQDIHHRETAQRGELRKELETLKTLNHKITKEAHELSTALHGQKKLQGNWGELVLENVLDRSGLTLGKDYKREVSFNTEDGRRRPDVIVYLPQDKHLIIDAKVSLVAYTEFVNSEDEAVRARAIKQHVTAMSDRINELADRDYYKLPGLNSPEMVFMFVPIESAFVEALKADETLFQKAIENNVLVATPTTLLTSLNIVRQLWRYEDQNKHTAKLAELAEGVFKKLNTFLGSFETLKKSLDKAQEAYGKAEGQLISGRGNLVKQVGEFKNLAPAIKAELPDYFTEKAKLEIDFTQPENYEVQSLKNI